MLNTAWMSYSLERYLKKHDTSPPVSDTMHKWCNYPWITCIRTTLTRMNFTRAPCSCKQWRFKKLPSRLFVPENTLLRGTILPHTSHDVSPLDYRRQGKTWTLQLPVLCLVGDYLNCRSPLITQETVLSNQAPSSSPWLWPTLSPSQQPLLRLLSDLLSL